MTPARCRGPQGRRVLPHRRPGEVHDLVIGNHKLAATINIDPTTGHPAELFLSGARDGADLQAILDDASVVISIALQCGIRASALAKSVARDDGRLAVSVIGAALDLVAAIEAEADSILNAPAEANGTGTGEFPG